MLLCSLLIYQSLLWWWWWGRNRVSTYPLQSLNISTRRKVLLMVLPSSSWYFFFTWWIAFPLGTYCLRREIVVMWNGILSYYWCFVPPRLLGGGTWKRYSGHLLWLSVTRSTPQGSLPLLHPRPWPAAISSKTKGCYSWRIAYKLVVMRQIFCIFIICNNLCVVKAR